MDNTTRFTNYISALRQFSSRNGNCRVPAVHIEIVGGMEIALGAWVGYVRQRKRKNQLSEQRIVALEKVPGWEWGPLRPGPATDIPRNVKIHELRAAGASLSQIADEFDLSRQRIHQIVKRTNAQR